MPEVSRQTLAVSGLLRQFKMCKSVCLSSSPRIQIELKPLVCTECEVIIRKLDTKAMNTISQGILTSEKTLRNIMKKMPTSPST